MLIEYWEGSLNDAERDLNPHEIKTFVNLFLFVGMALQAA